MNNNGILLTPKEEREFDKVFYEMDKLLSEVVDDKSTSNSKSKCNTNKCEHTGNLQGSEKSSFGPDGNLSLFT